MSRPTESRTGPEPMTGTEIVMVHAPCPLGCQAQDEVLLTARDRITHREGLYWVVHCRGCGLIRTDPRPDVASIGYFYPDEYPPYQLSEASATTSKFSTPGGTRRILARLTARSRRLPPIRPGRLLEIGCASGQFLASAAADGWQADGLEFSPAAAERARQRGFRVFTGTVEDADLPQSYYDLVVGWMVLEHLHDPIAALKKLRGAVRSEGWLALSVPDFSCIGQRIFAENWHALQVPSHLIHLTPATARRLLQAGGWRIMRIEHQRNLSSWMISIAWWMQDRGLFRDIARTLERYPDWSIAARLPLYPLALFAGITRQSGRMNVWAQPIAGHSGAS